MIIRQATINDAEGLHAIETAVFSTPWSIESLIHDLDDEERTLYYVIEEGSKIVGYAGAWIVADEGQITNVAVLEDYRHEGNGAILVRKLMRELLRRGVAELFLEVRQSNFTAIALYRRFGFTVKGIRKNYYEEPLEDAYVMSVQRKDVKL